MIVCIAEKPSVALEIAKILGASQRKDGYFEGNGYQVTWTFGHLCMLKSPDLRSPVYAQIPGGLQGHMEEMAAFESPDDS